jgi:predicted hydrolase (HD superfamily)
VVTAAMEVSQSRPAAGQGFRRRREYMLDRYRGGMVDLEAWAFELASEKLAGVLPRRWAHVQGVGKRVRIAAPLFSVDDCALLVSAALLHDIGYAPELAYTGFHPLDGARYLRGVGGPDRLVNLVAHHSCATLEAELRGLSDQLAEFEDERTALRDALWWADMTTTPDGGETTAVERVAEIQTRYGPDDLVSRFIRRAWVDLNAVAERTQRRLEAAGISQV